MLIAGKGGSAECICSGNPHFFYSIFTELTQRSVKVNLIKKRSFLPAKDHRPEKDRGKGYDHMTLKGWNGKKTAAACLGGGVLLAAVALTQDYQNSIALAEGAQTEKEVTLAIAGEEQEETQTTGPVEEKEKEGVTLSLADDTKEETEAAEEETPAAGEQETEAEEKETEEKKEPVSYETLETTVTGEEGITAMDVSGIVENCMPSIVSITNQSVQEVESYFYGSQKIEAESAGSGIIIAQNDTELMIATNKHVVEDAKKMTVCFTVDVENPEDAVVEAVTKGTDATYDLAVVAVELSDIPEEVLGQLKIATLGSSDKLKVGETAIAIGNALGVGQTVTCGIISALEREITTDVGTFTELQTDAAINFGCSGGALLNKRGEVIGINSAKANPDYAESMGYAIPIDTAIPVLTNLINRETRTAVKNHGYMGITVVPVSDEAKEMYNMPAGAFVYEVNEGSAGEKAGLKKGDIITKFDGISIDSSDTLVETLGYYEAGETVKVEIQVAENGSYTTRELEVTLQEGTPEAEEEDEEEELQSLPEEEEDSAPEEFYGRGDGRGNMEDFYNFFFNGEDGLY